MTSTATLIDYPQALREKFGDRVSFSVISGVYWDGVDWCQYDEVLPRKEDEAIFAEKTNTDDFVDARDFFQK